MKTGRDRIGGMIRRISAPVVIYALLLGQLSACSFAVDESLQEGRVVPKNEGYGKSSCAFAYDEGDAALDSGNGASLETTFFGKKYVSAHLQAVLNASSAETVRYMENQSDLRVYRVDSNVGDCKMFASLDLPPSDIQKAWDKTSKSFEEKNSMLIGLYLEQGNSDIPSLQDRAAVLVREDTSRWTLVHEYMHHLFHSEAVQAGPSNNEVRNALKNASDRFEMAKEEYRVGRSDAQFQELVASLEELVESIDALLTRFLLEEATIETILIGLHKEKKMGFVSDLETKNGVSYIVKSSESARSVYSQLSEEVDVAYYDSRSVGSLDARLATLRSKISDRQAEVLKLRDDARALINDPQPVAGANMVVGATAAHGGPQADCSHSKEAEEILKSFMNKRGKGSKVLGL